MDLETAVSAQVGDKAPEEITELVLDACKATKITGLDAFVNLEVLTLNGCGLTTLEGFPTLSELKTLELADNQLADGCLEALQDAALINLTRLSLAGNRFQTLDALEPLSSCVNLRDLDLFNCAVTEIEDYRDGVFGLIPALLYLDGFDADDNEKPEEDDDDEGDEDLLSSEVGEDDDDDEGESGDDDIGLGGELDGEDGDPFGGYDDDPDGEEGFDGEEGDEEDEDEDEEEEDEDDVEEEDDGAAAQGAAKRQKR